MRDKLPDFCEVVEPLDAAWEGYEEVLIFATEMSPYMVEAWYRKLFAASALHPEEGTFEVYLPGGRKQGAAYSVVFVDAEHETAFEELHGPVAGGRLRALCSEGYRTVGLGFAHAEPRS